MHFRTANTTWLCSECGCWRVLRKRTRSSKAIKRTAFVALRLFLRSNGFDMDIEDSEAWAEPVLGLIEHLSTEEDFVKALRPYIVPLP
jgi:hypothetical protein